MIDGWGPVAAGRADGAGGAVRLFLAGDVMTGRGIDQILAHPGDPRLRENWVRDARRYVELAEAVNGPIDRPVGFEWIWGDALVALAQVAPAVSVINLETAVTSADSFAQDKGINYRMNPRNLPAIVVARPDVCVLANNHVLDFERPGLSDTLGALAGAGLVTVGAGEDLEAARRPATVPVPGTGGRIVVLACAAASAGVPDSWAAKADRSGVWFLPSLADTVADEIVGYLGAVRRPGDICVVSLHWGSNWGWAVSHEQVRFARRLVDGGVDIVYGHSSHHPRPIEVYRRRLILYGCGDLVNDYEGIPGQEEFRSDLRLLYFPTVYPNGELAGLAMRAVRARRMRLERAPAEDVRWLAQVLEETSERFKTRIESEGGGEGALTLAL